MAPYPGCWLAFAGEDRCPWCASSASVETGLRSTAQSSSSSNGSQCARSAGSGERCQPQPHSVEVSLRQSRMRWKHRLTPDGHDSNERRPSLEPSVTRRPASGSGQLRHLDPHSGSPYRLSDDGPSEANAQKLTVSVPSTAKCSSICCA